MIWLLLAFAVFPPGLSVEGASGQSVEIPLLLVGDEPVLVTADSVLVLDEQVVLSGSHHVTFFARIRASTPPGNYTSYVYVQPERQDAVVLASAVPVRVAVHTPGSTTRVIPAPRSGVWAALGGVFTLMVGAFFAVSARKE